MGDSPPLTETYRGSLSSPLINIIEICLSTVSDVRRFSANTHMQRQGNTTRKTKYMNTEIMFGLCRYK